jgi:ketosteroid isomerase-like protein
MGVDIGSERRRHREEAFTELVRAFARHDYEALEGGVRPDVELTLRGSSWLAGKYRGYAEFGQYVAGAALVLGPGGGQLSYHHDGAEMNVVHEFVVGPTAVRMPLHEVVTFDDEQLVASLLIRPWDQDLFDEAVNAFLASTSGPAGSRSKAC